MRAAFLVNQFPVRSETFIWSQLQGLLERGVEVDVFAEGPEQQPLPSAEETLVMERAYYWITMPPQSVNRFVAGLSSYLISRRSWKQTLRLARRAVLGRDVARRFQEMNYDVLHAQFGPKGLTGVQLKRSGLFRGRLVTSFRGYDVGSYVRRRGPEVYRSLAEEGDLFLPVCGFFADELVRIGFPQERIRVLRSGIDVPSFPYAIRKPPLPGEPFRLVSVGRLVEKKGFHVAVRALARLRRERPDLKFQYVIAGEGERRGAIEGIIRDEGLTDVVSLPGWKQRGELRELLSAAHIFLAPSVTARSGDREGIPNVLKEAMATGMPVVATAHSGIPELVIDGVTGCLVPEGDDAALANSLASLADHPERWAALGREARRIVEKDYNIEPLNDELLSLYRSLTGDESVAHAVAH